MMGYYIAMKIKQPELHTTCTILLNNTSHRINGIGKQIGEYTEYDPISKFPKRCTAGLYMT